MSEAEKEKISLILKSGIKNVAHAHDMHMSADLVEAIQQYIEQKLAKAVERAKANGRKTLQAHDF